MTLSCSTFVLEHKPSDFSSLLCILLTRTLMAVCSGCCIVWSEHQDQVRLHGGVCGARGPDGARNWHSWSQHPAGPQDWAHHWHWAGWSYLHLQGLRRGWWLLEWIYCYDPLNYKCSRATCFVFHHWMSWTFSNIISCVCVCVCVCVRVCVFIRIHMCISVADNGCSQASKGHARILRRNFPGAQRFSWWVSMCLLNTNMKAMRVLLTEHVHGLESQT